MGMHMDCCMWLGHWQVFALIETTGRWFPIKVSGWEGRWRCRGA